MVENTGPDYEGSLDVLRYFETNQQELSTAGTAEKVLDLHGGAAVIVKALVGNTGNIYLGDRAVSASTGFELAPGESLKVEYLPEKKSGEFLEIWADCATSGDDICYIIVP